MTSRTVCASIAIMCTATTVYAADTQCTVTVLPTLTGYSGNPAPVAEAASINDRGLIAVFRKSATVLVQSKISSTRLRMRWLIE